MTPKIYHLHPLVAGKLTDWERHFARIVELGFNYVCVAPPFQPGATGDIFLPADLDRLHPALHWDGSAEAGLGFAASKAAQFGLKLMLDVRLDRIAQASAVRQSHPGWFIGGIENALPDPRRPAPRLDAAYAGFDRTEVANSIAGWWSNVLLHLVREGVAGLRCLAPGRTPPLVWRRVIADLREADPALLCLAWTRGIERAALNGLEGLGFDRVIAPEPSWHRGAASFLEEAEALRRIAPLVGSPEAAFDDRLLSHLPRDTDPRLACRRALRLAAAIGNGVFMPMGFEFATRLAFDAARATPADFERIRQEAPVDLTRDVADALALADRMAAIGVDGALRSLSVPSDPCVAILRTDAADVRDAARAAVILINPHAYAVEAAPWQNGGLPPQAGAPFGSPATLDGDDDPLAPLYPGEVRVIACRRPDDVRQPRTAGADLHSDLVTATRIAIEAVSPCVPDGDFAVKWIVGMPLTIAADIFADGHDRLAASLLWRAADEVEWRRAAFHPAGNDRWEASFTPTRVGIHVFTVEAWWDVWGTYRHDLQVKRQAGQPVLLEIAEGRALIKDARVQAPEPAGLDALLTDLADADEADRVALLLSPETLALMQAAEVRPFLASLAAPIQVRADRPQAAFASWYELFPRSVTTDPGRHGTFRDVIARLPAIRDMGFDVLYFPPIHPIGTANRKGRNNALRAEDGDVGSPYAIGGPDGGHDALHPQLGTLDDFRDLIAAAKAHGLEIALDFAIQCSPDHPWLRAHPDWFRWRPDGSLRYAENPPKKYEDIVNPDFYAPAAIPSLWRALRDVVLFWVAQGITTFRVDNPHTKPLPFWHWMIGDIQARNPNVLFLSEAFTRPKVMYRLAKVGFSQSYTYFTWRNTKSELRDYLTELNRSPARDCFRPNFFVNTPDINPVYLQQAGRAGFLIRAALAATLSGLWGMYSGFEICENAPLPGREEYLDSEKYQIRVRDFSAAGNIIQEITQLNRIRRAHPALQTHLGVTFYDADNDQVLLYGKARATDRDIILVAVSLDPHNAQATNIEVPLWQMGLPDHGSVAVRDLMRDEAFVWRGKYQRVHLDPAGLPFAIWQLSPAGAGA